MMRLLRVFCVCAAFLGAALPAAADTPVTLGGPAPVQIEDCKPGDNGNFLLSETNGDYAITFTNESKVTADLVRFEIDYADQQLFIRDVGKFSPGITIVHKFHGRGVNVVSSPLLDPKNAPVCKIAAVHFSDGTEWNAPATASAARIGVGWLGVDLKQRGHDVVVGLVYPSGPANAAGLRQGDVIESIDDNRIGSLDEVGKLLNLTPAGTPLHVVVRRNEQAVDFRVVVAERP